MFWIFTVIHTLSTTFSLDIGLLGSWFLVPRFCSLVLGHDTCIAKTEDDSLKLDRQSAATEVAFCAYMILRKGGLLTRCSIFAMWNYCEYKKNLSSKIKSCLFMVPRVTSLRVSVNIC